MFNIVNNYVLFGRELLIASSLNRRSVLRLPNTLAAFACLVR